MDTQRFRNLSAKDRLLVSIAILLDGREASTYLASDSVNGAGLKKAALDVAAIEPELRMPLVGTWLRQALSELGALGGRTNGGR